MSNRKEDIKKTLGISEYPWSSDDEEETIPIPSSSRNVSSMLQDDRHLPATRHSLNDMPGTSGQSAPSTSRPNLDSTMEQSQAQAKIDRNMFWSIINNQRILPSVSNSQQPMNIHRSNRVTPAADHQEVNLRPSLAADVRRIMAYKKLNRSFNRPSKTALNLSVQRSPSSPSTRHVLTHSMATEIVAKIRASRTKRFAQMQSMNATRSSLNAMINPSGNSQPSTSGSAAPTTSDIDRDVPAINLAHSDEEPDIFTSTRMEEITNRENSGDNNETSENIADQGQVSVSLEEEIVEIDNEPAIPGINEPQPTTSNEAPANEVHEERPATPKRRTSADEDDDGCTLKEFNQRLLRVLECPVCMEWVGAPMSQCRRGHLVCAACRARLAACPVCRTAFCSVRNRAMEAVAELLRYPCRHGCGRELRWRRRSSHEASCSARRYPCPAPACASTPAMTHHHLAQHAHSKHPSLVKVGRSHKFSVRLNTEQHTHWFIMALQEMFHLKVDVDARMWGVVIHVAYIGPKCKSKNFMYEVSVSGQQKCRKLVYGRLTHSDLESSTLNVSRQDCFHLTLDQAMNFLRFKNRHYDAEKILDFEVEINTAAEANKDDSDS